jgi:hypothetical protein
MATAHTVDSVSVHLLLLYFREQGLSRRQCLKSKFTKLQLVVAPARLDKLKFVGHPNQDIANCPVQVDSGRMKAYQRFARKAAVTESHIERGHLVRW